MTAGVPVCKAGCGLRYWRKAVSAAEGLLRAALARPAWQRTPSFCAERQGVAVADIS